MTPACHIVHYKGLPVYYMNGVYKTEGKYFLSFSEAKREIDKQDKEFFFNLKRTDAQKA